MSALAANRQHAIVLGGSMSGLLTARVLSDRFDLVTIIEKDRVNDRPESRPGQPQTRHLHGLLAMGLKTMTDYFPDLPQALVAKGAVVNDFAEGMRWYCYGGYRQPFKIGFSSVTTSRMLLEYLVRERTLALPQVRLIDRATVTELVTTADRRRVIGLKLSQHQEESLSADLIVDATGRNSPTPQWLQALGYEPPTESRVTVNVGYATRIYRRDPEDPRSHKWMACTPTAPQQRRFGAMFPVEGNRWIVSAGGWHGEHCPTDDRGFLEFVRSLPSSDMYDIISQSEPLSEIVPFKFPFGQRRHYERLNRFPAGYLVIGDAFSSFNPTYGQGMTVAAIEAATLDRLLARDLDPDRLAHVFFQQIAKIVDIPWQLAIGEDFRFPETTGTKPFGIDLLNSYAARVHRATLTDPVVGAAFLKVMNLMAPPTTLFHPQIVWRVLKSGGV